MRYTMSMTMAVLATALLMHSTPISAADSQIYGMRPNPGREFKLGPIGATGIIAHIYKGMQITVKRNINVIVLPDSPVSIYKE
jgi:hypothetical protein